MGSSMWKWCVKVGSGYLSCLCLFHGYQDGRDEENESINEFGDVVQRVVTLGVCLQAKPLQLACVDAGCSGIFRTARPMIAFFSCLNGCSFRFDAGEVGLHRRCWTGRTATGSYGHTVGGVDPRAFRWPWHL